MQLIALAVFAFIVLTIASDHDQRYAHNHNHLAINGPMAVLASICLWLVVLTTVMLYFTH